MSSSVYILFISKYNTYIIHIHFLFSFPVEKMLLAAESRIKVRYPKIRFGKNTRNSVRCTKVVLEKFVSLYLVEVATLIYFSIVIYCYYLKIFIYWNFVLRLAHALKNELGRELVGYLNSDIHTRFLYT